MTGVNPEWVAGRDFIMLHLDLVDALNGSYAAAALVSRIAYRADDDGWWTATRDQLCAETRLTPAVLRRALDELREAGMIESERVSRFDATQRWRVVLSTGGDFRIHDAEQVTDTVSVDSTGSTVLSEQEELPPSSPVQLALVGAADVEQPTDVIAAEFDGFWKHWPDKRGRKAALTAYRRARKRATLDVIAAGVRAHVPVLQAKIDNGDRQFVPHAATWLNQDRWADPAPPMPRAADPYGAVDNPTLLAQSSSYGDPYAGLTGTQPATRSIGGSS